MREPTPSPRPRLFRGAGASEWKKHLERERGWPPMAAAMMAGFLVGQYREPPSWDALHGAAKADPDHSRLERVAEDDALVDKWFEEPK